MKTGFFGSCPLPYSFRVCTQKKYLRFSILKNKHFAIPFIITHGNSVYLHSDCQLPTSIRKSAISSQSEDMAVTKVFGFLSKLYNLTQKLFFLGMSRISKIYIIPLPHHG